MASRCNPSAKIEQVAADIALPDDSTPDRIDDIAGLLARSRAGIDVNARARHRLIIGLAHVRREAADEINVGSGFQPRATYQRFSRKRRAGDDIGRAHRAF